MCTSAWSPKGPERAADAEKPLALLRQKREQVLNLAAQHGAHDVRIFGSVARGEADDRSDLDFLVTLDAGRSLLDLGGLRMDLQDLLDRRLDVVTELSLKELIRDRVLREARPL